MLILFTLALFVFKNVYGQEKWIVTLFISKQDFADRVGELNYIGDCPTNYVIDTDTNECVEIPKHTEELNLEVLKTGCPPGYVIVGDECWHETKKKRNIDSQEKLTLYFGNIKQQKKKRRGNRVVFFGNCPTGYVRVGNECIKQKKITRNHRFLEDCPSGYVKIYNKCRKQKKKIKYDTFFEECPPGYVKINSKCRRQRKKRIIHGYFEDCPSGYIKIDNKCIEQNKKRQYNERFLVDCLPGYVKIDNKCRKQARRMLKDHYPLNVFDGSSCPVGTVRVGTICVKVDRTDETQLTGYRTTKKGNAFRMRITAEPYTDEMNQNCPCTLCWCSKPLPIL